MAESAPELRIMSDVASLQDFALETLAGCADRSRVYNKEERETLAREIVIKYEMRKPGVEIGSDSGTHFSIMLERKPGDRKRNVKTIDIESRMKVVMEIITEMTDLVLAPCRTLPNLTSEEARDRAMSSEHLNFSSHKHKPDGAIKLLRKRTIVSIAEDDAKYHIADAYEKYIAYEKQYRIGSVRPLAKRCHASGRKDPPTDTSSHACIITGTRVCIVSFWDIKYPGSEQYIIPLCETCGRSPCGTMIELLRETPAIDACRLSQM